MVFFMDSILESPIAMEKAEEGSKIISIIAYVYITILFAIFILGWIGLRYLIPYTYSGSVVKTKI